MDWNEYIEETRRNAMEYLDDEAEEFDSFADAWHHMQLDDSVTGSASGSFYDNSRKASEALSGIIFDFDVVEIFRDAGYTGIPIELGAEACDAIARCLALEASYDELEDMFDDMKAYRE